MKENFLLSGFIIVVVALGYLWYTQWRPVVATSETVTEQVYGGEFLAMTVKLKSIKLETDFFQSSEFLFFTDQTPVIEVPQVIGKKNPFLPLVLPEKQP